MKFLGAASGRIMETLTSGLYDGNSNCVREYVQNAIDSGSKLIEVSYQNYGVDVIVRDYGSGMDADELYQALLIGNSEKAIYQGGWRGVGIYSGVPNFSKIYINTKKGSGKKLSVSIDCNAIRKWYLEDITVEQLLEYGVPGEIEEESDPSFKSGTQIILSGLLRTQISYFEEDKLRNYLIRTLPLSLEESNLKKRIVTALEDNGIHEPNYIVKFEGKEIKRPPLDGGLFDLDTFTVSRFTDGSKNIAVIWSVTSLKNSELKGVHRGIVFKKKGYTIGGPETVRNLYQGTYSYWQYGEIHVLDENILENSSRNNFEINSGSMGSLVELTAKYLEQSQQNNRKKSAYDQRNEIAETAKKIEEGDIKKAEEKIQKMERRLSSNVIGAKDGELRGVAVNFDKKREENKKELSKLHSKLAKVKRTGEADMINTLISTLSKKDQKEVREVAFHEDMDTFTHLLSDIEKKIRRKTGVDENEFIALMKSVFSSSFNDSPDKIKSDAKLLLFDPGKFIDGIENEKNANQAENFTYYVSAGFGSLLYEMFNLFVNGGKHHKNKIKELWFQGSTPYERAEFFTEVKNAVKFLEKVVDKTVLNENHKKGSA